MKKLFLLIFSMIIILSSCTEEIKVKITGEKIEKTGMRLPGADYKFPAITLSDSIINIDIWASSSFMDKHILSIGDTVIVWRDLGLVNVMQLWRIKDIE